MIPLMSHVTKARHLPKMSLNSFLNFAVNLYGFSSFSAFAQTNRASATEIQNCIWRLWLRNTQLQSRVPHIFSPRALQKKNGHDVDVIKHVLFLCVSPNAAPPHAQSFHTTSGGGKNAFDLNQRIFIHSSIVPFINYIKNKLIVKLAACETGWINPITRLR